MSRRLSSVYKRVVLAVSAAALVTSVLVSCTPEEAPSSEPTESTQPAPTTPAAEAPVFHPDGTAEDNLPLFTAVTETVWASDEKHSGRAYIEALTSAGFDRAQMQVTNDHTTVGNPAESIQFAVRWGEELCLIGQVGPSTIDPVTLVMDQLPEGRCLIGNTQPIDW